MFSKVLNFAALKIRFFCNLAVYKKKTLNVKKTHHQFLKNNKITEKNV